MSDDDKMIRDIELGKQMHTVACQECGSTVGWVHGNRYRREVESKRAALAKAAALEAENQRLQGRLADVLQHNEVLSANNERLAEANLELWGRVRQLETQLAERSLDGVQHSEYPEGKQ